MSNFTIENIGALELNYASVLLSDGTLEATAVDVGPTATVTANHPFTYCPRINDGALEASAGQAMAGPTIAPCTVMTCPRIDDGELETVAAMIASPSFDSVCGSTIGPRCFRRIDDGVLEAMVVSAGPNLGPPTGRGWTGACCGRIDDGALEASAQAAPPMTMIPCPFRIDDGAN